MELRQRVARAIWSSLEGVTHDGIAWDDVSMRRYNGTSMARDNVLSMADAAIASVLDAMQEPSPGVIEEGRWPAEDDGPLACWQAMLAAFRREALGEAK